MRSEMLHVFRNTPFGRETLMQSGYFAGRAGVQLAVYIPRFPQFLMYFDQNIVTVDLDRAFLRSPETARAHVEEILSAQGVSYRLFEPVRFTAPTLPELPTTFSYMCCPRSISDLSTKVGLGYIGPRVRDIVQHAAFPVLIPQPVYKEWKGITCFFGGSANSLHALACALDLGRACGAPVQLFTQAEGRSKQWYERAMEAGGLGEAAGLEWIFLDSGDFAENLYEVPHDALVVIGAYGHGLAKELFFGSKMETVQSVLPNAMLIAGPNYPLG